MTRTPDSVYLRRRLGVFGGAGLVLLLVLYTLGLVVAPAPAAQAVAAKNATIRAQAADLAWPDTGSAAVGIVGRPGLLASTRSEKRVPIASMTKTVTALVLLDRKPIRAGSDGPTITFTRSDVDTFHAVQDRGGSWAPVVAGERLTERQALEAMLLPSANNYAISLARWGYGSVKAFLAAANSWLQKHGLDDTHLADPAGLDPKTVSTPKDLVEIGKRVLANPVLAKIVSTPEVTLPGAGHQKNGNRLLGHHGIDGIKTGFTDEAGHCLLFSARVEVGGATKTVVGVMLGQEEYEDLWRRVPPLLASVRAGFHRVTLAKPGQSFGTVDAAWGASVPLVAERRTSMLVWSDTPVHALVRGEAGAADAGSPAGEVTFTAGGRSKDASLVLGSALEGPGLWWRLTHPGSLF